MNMLFKKNILLICNIILTIYSLYSLKYLFKLKHIESEFYMNVTFLLVTAAVYMLINYSINILKNGIDKRLLIISVIMGLYFAFTSVLGAYYEGESKGERYAEVLDFTLNQFVISLKYIPALWFLFLSAVLFIFIQIPKIYNHYIIRCENFTEMPKIFNKLYKIWLFIFICWLPYFILLYPGYMNPDAMRQIEQVNNAQFFPQNPILTTLYMAFIPLYYKISNNGALSTAIYIIFFQMLPLSFIYAYMIKKLSSIYNTNKMIVMFIILLVALYPFNPLISIIIEKGILFVIFLILFIVKLIELVENDNLLRDKKKVIQFIMIGAVLCLTRNNVIYGLFFIIPVMLIFYKQYRKQISLLFLGMFITFLIFNGIIKKSTGAGGGDFHEGFSIPMQQIARVYKYHKDKMDSDEIKSVENMMMNVEKLKEYHPKLSDEIKLNVNKDFFQTKEFAVLYFKLLFQYPGTYLNAFLIMNSSLLYPFENSFWREGLTLFNLPVQAVNLTDTDYVKHKNKWLHNYLLKNQQSVSKNNSMMLFVLLNQSFLFYIMLTAFLYFIYKKLYKHIFILLIPFGYTATLSLGPIIYLRYTYFLAALLPVVIFMLTSNKYSGNAK